MRFSEIANRITGFSTPIFGVQWTPPQLDREVAERVILFLEDRRVLYETMEAEVPEYGVESVLEIRGFLTQVIGEGGVSAELSDGLRAMRAACRKFLSSLQERSTGGALYVPSSSELIQGFGRGWNFNQALGELRGIFGVHLGKLAVHYGVDIPEPLSVVLPLDPTMTTAFRGPGAELKEGASPPRAPSRPHRSHMLVARPRLGHDWATKRSAQRMGALAGEFKSPNEKEGSGAYPLPSLLSASVIGSRRPSPERDSNS